MRILHRLHYFSMWTGCNNSADNCCPSHCKHAEPFQQLAYLHTFNDIVGWTKDFMSDSGDMRYRMCQG